MAYNPLGTINVTLLNPKFIKRQRHFNRNMGILAFCGVAYSVALTLELKRLREEVNMLTRKGEEM